MIYTKKIKKFITYSILSILISTLLSFIYIFQHSLPDSIDNRLRDYLFIFRGEVPNSDNVIVIDIDEISVKELGQWPWSRNKISKIIQNLTDANVGIIGMDVVFAEEDNSSPHLIFKKYKIRQENIPNYDQEFSETISKSPVILGYQFELEESKYVNKKAPAIPAIFIEKNKLNSTNQLIEAKGTILNTSELQDVSYSSGFFNNIPDDGGIIRSVPLIISYKDNIYPSLALEIIRTITDSKKVVIDYDKIGVSSISLNNINIPTDRYGRIIVNFRGKERNFKYYSAIDIYENNFYKKEIEGKIALIGTSAAGLLDLRSTPFESIYPGVEVHANVIDNILVGDYIYKPSWIDGANILIIFILSFIIVISTTYIPFLWSKPLIFIFSSLAILVLIYEVLFQFGLIFNIFFPLLTILTASICTILYDYFHEIKKEEAIKIKFASKVSKNVMENLLNNIDTNEFHATEKEVTIFFSDIRNFTNISEKMNNAKKTINYLNSYMEPMSNIIIKYDGTIDKYIGDAIMAYWNAPSSVENHADKALLASLEQLEELKKLNIQLIRENKPIIDIGIGLNTGTVIVGEIGSKGRSDYTVIGDSINLGYRIESLCKYYNSELIISNLTKEKLIGNYIFRYLDLVKVKGKEKAIEIWQVLGIGEENDSLKKELDLYHEGIKYYKNCNFEKALSIFQILKNSNVEKDMILYNIYIERCEKFIKTPPLNFDGIYTHETKF